MRLCAVRKPFPVTALSIHHWSSVLQRLFHLAPMLWTLGGWDGRVSNGKHGAVMMLFRYVGLMCLPNTADGSDGSLEEGLETAIHSHLVLWRIGFVQWRLVGVADMGGMLIAHPSIFPRQSRKPRAPMVVPHLKSISSPEKPETAQQNRDAPKSIQSFCKEMSSSKKKLRFPGCPSPWRGLSCPVHDTENSCRIPWKATLL